MNFWKNNNFFVGLTVAALLIVATLLLLIVLVPLIYNILSIGSPNPKLIILAVVPAILIMRYYTRKLQFSKAGSGALVVVFASIIFYFLYFAKSVNQFPSLF